MDNTDEDIYNIKLDLPEYNICVVSVTPESIKCSAEHKNNHNVILYDIPHGNKSIRLSYWIGLQSELILEPKTHIYIPIRHMAPRTYR